MDLALAPALTRTVPEITTIVGSNRQPELEPGKKETGSVFNQKQMSSDS